MILPYRMLCFLGSLRCPFLQVNGSPVLQLSHVAINNLLHESGNQVSGLAMHCVSAFVGLYKGGFVFVCVLSMVGGMGVSFSFAVLSSQYSAMVYSHCCLVQVTLLVADNVEGYKAYLDMYNSIHSKYQTRLVCRQVRPYR